MIKNRKINSKRKLVENKCNLKYKGFPFLQHYSIGFGFISLKANL